MKAQDYKISSEKFVFRAQDGNLHDKKLETVSLFAKNIILLICWSSLFFRLFWSAVKVSVISYAVKVEIFS